MNAAAEPSLDPLLRQAERLVAAASTLSVSLADLSIDLPLPSRAAIDQAQLRAIAALYLASQIESAGVVSTAEDLCRLARTGALRVDLGPAAPLIDAFWRGRHDRAGADERRSFFAALFGADGPDAAAYPPNDEFDDLLIDLCEALYKLDEQATNLQWGGVAQQARVRRAGERLLHNISQRSSGITAFMAQEILAAIRQAIAILNHQAVQAAFGVRTLSAVISTIGRRSRRVQTADFSLFARRGQSGLTILAWLAEAAPLLSSSQPLLGIDHPVVSAAIDWLETSLRLTEIHTSATSGRGPAGGTDAGWAALAG